MQILALSGSLRAASSNTTLLRAAAQLAPPGIEVNLFDGLGDLPHYNPDLDQEPLPGSVVRWRTALRECDAVLICCPEYAHGVPGSFKNALDWIVSSGEFMHKPTALIEVSSRSGYARAALLEILKVMMARIVEPASLTVGIATNRVSEAQIVEQEGYASVLETVWRELLAAIQPKPE